MRTTADARDRTGCKAQRNDSTMKVMLASEYYPPYIGGVQRQIQQLAGELTARGHDVSVATIWSPGSPAFEAAPWPVYRLRQLRTAVERWTRPGKKHAAPGPDPITVAAMRTALRRERPDVVHTYGWISYSVAAAVQGTSTPVVLSARDYAQGCATRTLVAHGELCSGPSPRRCLACTVDHFGAVNGPIALAGTWASSKLLIPRICGLHSVSTYVRDSVRELWLDDRARGIPHEVIPSFMSDAEFDDADDDPALEPYLRLLPDEPFIAFAGALRGVKGVGVLLNAYEGLSSPPPLVLIGTRERETPRSLPPGVTIAPDFPHGAVMAAWRRSLFGVAPSLWPEPLGSVVYEGMSRGRAMIGTRPGGHTDMIDDGRTGILVPGGNATALRAAMQRLIDDPALRTRLGEAARVDARAYTASHAVPRFEALYRDALATHQGARAVHAP